VVLNFNRYMFCSDIEYAAPTQPHHRDVETWHITEPRPHTAFYLAPEDRFHTTLSTSQAQIRLERAPTNPLPSPAYRDGPAKLVLIASPRGKEKAALADALRTSYLAPSEASQRAVDHRDTSLQSPVSAQLSARSAALSATAVNADERAQRLLSSVARGMRAFVGETRTTFNVSQDLARRASQHDEHIRSMSAQHTRWLGALARASEEYATIAVVVGRRVAARSRSAVATIGIGQCSLVWRHSVNCFCVVL
jgi:hypothetical protein